MKRSVAPFALCFVLALLVAAPVSIGADKPPKELWDEFPLDATPTPGAQAPERTAAPSAQPRRAETQPEDDSGGISMPALVALLVGAAGLGGGAVFVASRRMRSAGDGPAPEPVVATGRFTRVTDAGSAAAVAATNGHPREAPAHDEPPRKPHSMSREKAARRAKRAKPAPANPRPRRTADEKPRQSRRAATKAEEPRPRRAARKKPPAEPLVETRAEDVAPHEAAPAAEPVVETPAGDVAAPEAPPLDAPADDVAAPADPTRDGPPAVVDAGDALESEEVPPTDDVPAAATDEAAASQAAEAREARRAARRRKRDEVPAKPRRRKREDRPAQPLDKPAAEAIPEPAAEAIPEPQPEPTESRTPRPRRVERTPSPEEQPAPGVPSRARRDDIGAERIAAAAPQPVPLPVEPMVEVEDEVFPSCRIKFHNRPIRTHFYAVPYEGGPVLARSPYFKLQRGDDASGPTAPEALRALVEELRALGWQQTGVGSAPWDLRFQRDVRVAQRRG